MDSVAESGGPEIIILLPLCNLLNPLTLLKTLISTILFQIQTMDRNFVASVEGFTAVDEI
jgi:hypothetical protein